MLNPLNSELNTRPSLQIQIPRMHNDPVINKILQTTAREWANSVTTLTSGHGKPQGLLRYRLMGTPINQPTELDSDCE